MKIVFGVIEFLASFIEIFIIYRIYRGLFFEYTLKSSDKEITYDLMLASGGAIMVLILNYMSVISYFTLFAIVLYTSVSGRIMYREKYVKIFSISCFYVLCLSCFDFFIITLTANAFGGYKVFINLLSGRTVARVALIIIGKSLWLLLFICSKKYLYKFSFNKNNTYILLKFSGIGFMGFIYLVDKTFDSFANILTSVWFLFICVLTFFIFLIYFLWEKNEKNVKLKVAETRNCLLTENYEAINSIYTSNAKLYHDLNNHLNVLYQLLDKNLVGEAKEYITEISKPIVQLAKTTWTGVDVVDVIINSKIAKMRERGIEVEINAEFPYNTNIMPNDICTILANLLDNAIEATEKIEGLKRVEVTIRKINQFILIQISNPCISVNDISGELPKTSKKDKEFHGWGLSSVADTANKYNGTLKYKIKDNKFIVTVMLFFEKVC